LWPMGLSSRCPADLRNHGCCIGWTVVLLPSPTCNLYSSHCCRGLSSTLGQSRFRFRDCSAAASLDTAVTVPRRSSRASMLKAVALSSWSQSLTSWERGRPPPPSASSCTSRLRIQLPLLARSSPALPMTSWMSSRDGSAGGT
jgi:hypothetical protein